MMTATAGSFVLRIFFFGMVGFVPDKSGTTVVLPADPMHFAYLAYKQAACQSNCSTVKVWGSSKAGAKLKGYDIRLTPLPTGAVELEGEHQPPPQGPLPKDQAEAAYFYWVPGMSRVMQLDAQNGKINDGKIQDGCLAGIPTQPTSGATPCGLDLKGRLRLTSGKLSTCRLTELGGIGSKQEIYSYDFRAYLAGSRSTSQAIAAIARFETTITGSALSVNLVPFGAQSAGRPVVLKPDDCGGGNLCLDLAIGSPSQEQYDNFSTEVGTHFKIAHFLLKQEKRQFYLPERDHATSKPATGLQPLCNDIITVARLAANSASEPQGAQLGLPTIQPMQEGEDTLEAELAELFLKPGAYPPQARENPQSRPICPMAAYVAP
jgi:hypothetical protein